ADALSRDVFGDTGLDRGALLSCRSSRPARRGSRLDRLPQPGFPDLGARRAKRVLPPGTLVRGSSGSARDGVRGFSDLLGVRALLRVGARRAGASGPLAASLSTRRSQRRGSLPLSLPIGTGGREDRLFRGGSFLASQCQRRPLARAGSLASDPAGTS